MSYFSDDEDSIISGGSSDDDDDVENPTSIKKTNKQTSEELLDENENVDVDNIDSENDNDSQDESDLDDDSEYNYKDLEEIEKDIKTTENKDIKKKSSKSQYKLKNVTQLEYDDEDEEDDEDDDDENYLQKFNESISENYVLNNHPECVVHNYKEVLSMCSVIKDSNGIIIDDLHKTIPYLTKYERARILGVRSKQIDSGATPFVKLTEGIIEGYVIAEMELKEKKIPFIIRRPMPNGGSEYWFLKDLEDLSF